MLNLNMQFNLFAFTKFLTQKFINIKSKFGIKTIVTIIAFLLVIILPGLLNLIHLIQKNNHPQTENEFVFHFPTPAPITSELQKPILKDSGSISTKDWKIYKNDIFGISFNYPKEWGEVSTSPESYITHLDTVNKDYFDSTGIDFRYMVKMNFSKNDQVSINFINNEYSGEKYPNGHDGESGNGDSFIKLKETGNICDYHLSFGPDPEEFSGSLYEIYNTCEDGIKTVATINNITFNINLASTDHYYDLTSRQFFFKKLNNGYFDNLLIKNLITTSQTTEHNLKQDQVFPVNELENMAIFKKFVSTIQSFTPTATNIIVPQTNSTDNQDLRIIKQYYSLLANQKLTEAFAMHQNPKFSFQDFTGWYDQVYGANVHNIKQVSSNTYQFNVDLSEKNKPVSKYLTMVKVDDNKINTLSSEQVLSDEVKFGNYVAYTRLKSSKNEIVLIKNGTEKVIDSGDNDFQNKIGTSMSFHNPRFSPQGGYLIYDAGGWEWSSPTLYQLAKQQKVKINLSYADIFFSQDEKYLLSCTSAGIGSGVSAIVYSAPDFSVKKDFKNVIESLTFEPVIKDNHDETDISRFPMNTECSYSPEKSEYTIVVSNSDNQQKTIKYNLVTEKEIIQ